MAYDYSQEFLALHSETVGKLVRIAQSGEVLTYESERHQDIRARRYLVNGLLASIERNVAGMASIRTTIRTWSEYKNGIYRLYVGKPAHKLPGVVGSKKYEWTTMYHSAVGEKHLHAEEIVDQESLVKFVGVVTSLPAIIKTVEARVADLNDDALTYFKDLFNVHGWTPTADGNRLILTRA